jgi:mono/diheme cytochrome c family protein
MIEQPRYDPLEASDLFADGRSARQPVPGTVPYAGDSSPNAPALTGLAENGAPYQGFPVSVDAALVQHGKERYNIYCIPCHGAAGEGNGRVTGFGYGQPPSLLEANARGLSNGEIFQIIQNGRGKMFPYGYRVKAPERWAIIAYIRAMQIQNGAVNVQELTPEQIDQIGKQP